MRAFGTRSRGHLGLVDTVWQPHVLREYAFIADGERGALIDPDGCDRRGSACRTGTARPSFSALLGGAWWLHRRRQLTARYVWGGYYENGSR
jgi:hypothetical protein